MRYPRGGPIDGQEIPFVLPNHESRWVSGSAAMQSLLWVASVGIVAATIIWIFFVAGEPHVVDFVLRLIGK